MKSTKKFSDIKWGIYSLTKFRGVLKTYKAGFVQGKCLTVNKFELIGKSLLTFLQLFEKVERKTLTSKALPKFRLASVEPLIA